MGFFMHIIMLSYKEGACVTMTPKEAENLIMRDGWRLENIQGSHHQYTHPCKPGKVTIPFHTKPKDLTKRTLHSILRQAGLK